MEKGELPVIQLLAHNTGVTQGLARVPEFLGLAAQVHVKVVDRAHDHAQLIQKKIRDVVVVGLRVEEGAGVLGRCATYDA